MGVIKGMPNQAVKEILDAFGLKDIKNVYSFKLVMEPHSAAYIELGLYAEGEQIEKLKPILKKFELIDPAEVIREEKVREEMKEVMAGIVGGKGIKVKRQSN